MALHRCYLGCHTTHFLVKRSIVWPLRAHGSFSCFKLLTSAIYSFGWILKESNFKLGQNHPNKKTYTQFLFIFAALYIRSGDIVIMSGKSRTAFHAVPRIVKVGKENEPPPCLKWEDGLFANDVTMTSGANSDETSILDENVKFPDVVEKKTVVSQRTCTSSTEQTEKRLFQESCDNKNINKFGNVSSFESECIETSEGCQCNKNNFCSKSMKTLSSDEWRQFELYLSKTRINVNVRQVHELGKTMNPFVCNVKL